LISFIVLWGIDGLNSFLSLIPDAPHLYEPHNSLRLITGVLQGLALSIIVYPIFSFMLWRETVNARVVHSWRELGYFLVSAALLVWIVQTVAEFLLYPVAVLSVLGVLVMLTLVNTMIVLVVLRRDGKAEGGREALPFLLLGLLAALLEIGALGLLHFALSQRMALPA
jgi:hypothetical protein